jgi:Cu2+-exporting ATPase
LFFLLAAFVHLQVEADVDMKPGLKHPHAAHAMHMSHEMPPQSAAAHMGHDQHAGHSVAMFRDKFWLTLILTLPVVAWSREVQHWLGYTAPTFTGSQHIPAFLARLFFCDGSVFVRGARGELVDHRPGMMTLISLGIVVAFAASLAATFGFFQIDVWWEVATLITIMLLGHWLEMKAIAQARGALDALAALLPDTAERITEPGVEKVPLAELQVGDVVLVRPGLGCLRMCGLTSEIRRSPFSKGKTPKLVHLIGAIAR